MQLVIDIDKDRYEDIKRIASVQLNYKIPTVEQIVANGTPLPKGHGRLIDANNKIEVDTGTTFDWIVGATERKEYTIDYLIKKAGCEVPTIIEAEKEESHG